jgi:hypothetical protein
VNDGAEDIAERSDFPWGIDGSVCVGVGKIAARYPPIDAVRIAKKIWSI